MPRVKIFGTTPEHIDEAEDRFKFSRALDELKVRLLGVQPQPEP